MGWNDEDEKCKSCGQVTKQAKGFTKQNVKRLFSFKFSTFDIIITVMMILFLFMAYAYNAETSQCRNWINKMDQGGLEQCVSTCGNQCLMLKTLSSDAKTLK